MINDKNVGVGVAVPEVEANFGLGKRRHSISKEINDGNPGSEEDLFTL